jgi:hypothetical protein
MTPGEVEKIAIEAADRAADAARRHAYKTVTEELKKLTFSVEGVELKYSFYISDTLAFERVDGHLQLKKK